MEVPSVLDPQISNLFSITNLVMALRLLVLVFAGFPLVYFLSKWAHKLTLKKFTSQQAMIFQKLVFYIGITIIAMTLLAELNFKLSVIFGVAGIAGIAIGFASQTSVSNIISGLFLIAEKPFQIDDVITIGTTTGVVLSIDILSVKLRSFDNKFIRIPNETIIKSEVVNITKFPIRRVEVDVGVAYREDIDAVRKVLMDIAFQNPLCLNDPEPIVIFKGYGNSSIDFMFGVWAVREDWLKLKNSITEDIKKRFDKEGIEIPFPHVSLYAGSVTGPFPIKIVDERKE